MVTITRVIKKKKERKEKAILFYERRYNLHKLITTQKHSFQRLNNVAILC